MWMTFAKAEWNERIVLTSELSLNWTEQDGMTYKKNVFIN